MPERSLIARWFLLGGALLALIGIALWKLLPIPLVFPPFAVTALLACLYGAFCLIPRRIVDKKS